RDAHAAGLRLDTRGNTQPRRASACKSFARVGAVAGEFFREISRKVVNVQDARLGDYELRDVHDEINKQMRETRHWTNYRQNVAMLDDDGKEVLRTK
ncbi:hypothetical protein K438DRAFT_1541845, partial [Mycena galopus ATCC 62051]